MERRAFLLSPMVLALAAGRVGASPIDPKETLVLQRDQIKFASWDGLPPGSGEMASLYGDLNKPGPYLVLMKWNPGWFSAPHDFDPRNAEPVSAGGFVERKARTFHYDGVPAGTKEPAVIAIFGIGPVDIELADPLLPSWRRV